MDELDDLSLAGVEVAQEAMEEWRRRAANAHDHRAMCALQAWLDGVHPERIIDALKLEQQKRSARSMFAALMLDEDQAFDEPGAVEQANVATFAEWLGREVARLVKARA